ncbi:MAG: glycosyltransferase family 2 protein [Candidatus Omnitrophota bacterium]
MQIIFWLSLIILFYTYLGYPLLLWVLSKLFSKPVNKGNFLPDVSLIIVGHNEGRYIKDKIDNILALDYPKEKLEIIIGSDCSDDRTNSIVKEYKSGKVKLFVSDERKGKISLINRIVPQAKGGIIVFSDVRQKLKSDALRQLAANFNDTSVGCVSGELLYLNEDKNVASCGVGLYWRYEKFMRKLESSLGSMIGATGAIYALRKSLFVAPSEDTILDDVAIPLYVVARGYRAVFDESAKAYEAAAESSKEEFGRKARTLAGNFQLFSRYRKSLASFKAIFLWKFLSHKFLRAVAFIFLLALVIASFFLKHIYPYNFGFLAQTVFYLFAVSGFTAEKLRISSRFLSVPYMFCVLNLAAVQGFLRFILKKQKVTWEKVV